jgi:hypothetical protein
MTLDETIKREEELIKEQERVYSLCPMSESIFHCDGTKDCKCLKDGKDKGCVKLLIEHRQLLEWLKDYKRLKEQEHIISKVRTEILDLADADAYCDVQQAFGLGLMKAVDVFDKYKLGSEVMHDRIKSRGN